MQTMTERKNHMFKANAEQIRQWEAAALRVCQARGMDFNKSWWARVFLFAAANGLLRVTFTDEQVTRGRGNQHDCDEHFQFKTTATELELWSGAADTEGLNRSEWCRQVLDFAATLPEEATPKIPPGVIN